MRLFQFELIKLGKNKIFLALYIIERHTSVYFYVHEQRESYQRFIAGDDSADIDGYYGLELEAQESYLDIYTVFVEEMADRVNKMEQASLYAEKESFPHRNLIKTQEDFASFSGSVLTADNCFGIREFAGYNGGLLFMLVFLAVLTYYVLFLNEVSILCCS